MTQRKEEYVLSDGISRSTHRSNAVLATVKEVTAYALLYSNKIPPQYFVGTAQHEANFATNEIDTEPPDASGYSYVSKGIYQLSDDEAQQVGVPQANLLDLAKSTEVFAKLQENRLKAIELAIGHEAQRPDVWAYLAIAHNQGLRAALKTIKNYGLNWKAYKIRNVGAKIIAYGDDCITGGPSWACYCSKDI